MDDLDARGRVLRRKGEYFPAHTEEEQKFFATEQQVRDARRRNKTRLGELEGDDINIIGEEEVEALEGAELLLTRDKKALGSALVRILEQCYGHMTKSRAVGGGGQL